MEIITTNTQKKVIINPASFSEASTLKKEAMKCLSNAGLFKNLDFASISTMETSKIFGVLSELIVSMDSSTGFENAVFDCLSRCSCDNKAITRQLFDDNPELREDYYEIVAKCVEENLRPFFKSLSSELSNRLQGVDLDTQSQK